MMASVVEEKAEELKQILQKMPDVISVSKPKVEKNLIVSVTLNHKSLGRLAIKHLEPDNAPQLYDFYFQGLSTKSQNYFPPYPLFNPPLKSPEDLAQRITDWRKEDDWTVLVLTKGKRIIGMCLLKRYKTERPNSGLAIREEFHGQGLGFLLLSLVTFQGRMLNLKHIYASADPANIAALENQKKCGYQPTGRLVPHFGYKEGAKVIDRNDVEVILSL
jgi:RimJ/RimL family protein N-acetyltransferase